MKLSQFKSLIREEVRKAVNEQTIAEIEESELNEAFVPPFNPAAIEMIKDMVATGNVTAGAIVAVIYIILYTPVAGFGALVLGHVIYKKLKDRIDTLINDYKDNKQINPAQVKEFQNFAMNSISDLSPGKQKFITGLINKMKRTDISDKNTLVQLQRDVKSTLDKYAAAKKLSK